MQWIDNPIRFIDADGMWTEGANGYSTSDPNEIKSFLSSLNFDIGQRDKAVKKAREYVDKRPKGNSYVNGDKGEPGQTVDCSGMVSGCVIAGGEPDPNHDAPGVSGTGVQRIEQNIDKIDNEKDVVAGNIVTFHFDSGWPTHTGILTDVVKDKNGHITSFTMIDSHSGTGPDERSVTPGVGYLGEHIYGYYKWDTKPDQKSSGNTSLNLWLTNPIGAAIISSQIQKYSEMATDARAHGNYNVANYYSNIANQLYQSNFK